MSRKIRSNPWTCPMADVTLPRRRRPRPASALLFLASLLGIPPGLALAQPPAAVGLDGSVGRSASTKCSGISSFCLDAKGRLLLCDAKAGMVRVVSQDDRLLARWRVPFSPEVIDSREDGMFLVAGRGAVAILDSAGKVVRRGSLPAEHGVSSITHLGDDVFVCIDDSSGFSVLRLNGRLGERTRIISGLSGCCGQMDIHANKRSLYVAENARFAIMKYDRTGRKLAKYVHRDPKDSGYYGDGCCEPKNICFGSDGDIYAAASAQMVVKRYSMTGTYLNGVARVPNATGGCVRVTIALTPDRRKLYMLDTEKNVVRLLKPETAP